MNRISARTEHFLGRITESFWDLTDTLGHTEHVIRNHVNSHIPQVPAAGMPPLEARVRCTSHYSFYIQRPPPPPISCMLGFPNITRSGTSAYDTVPVCFYLCRYYNCVAHQYKRRTHLRGLNAHSPPLLYILPYLRVLRTGTGTTTPPQYIQLFG